MNSDNFDLLKPFLFFVGTILSIAIFQWACIQFMATYCAKWSMFGPVLNIISLGSPLCHFINHFQILLADHYITLWSTAAVAIFTWILMKTGGKKEK